MAGAFTSRNKDGSPRKLRLATHPRAIRRQARRIVEARTGRKLSESQKVHHGAGLGSQTKLSVTTNKHHKHAHAMSRKSPNTGKHKT